MLFQNKSFHGRHKEEKAALAEATSAACGGFSDLGSSRLGSRNVQSSGTSRWRRQQGAELIYCRFQKCQSGVPGATRVLSVFSMERKPSALGFISWKRTNGT